MDLGILFNLLQFIGGIILSIGYIPQIYKTVKTKSVKDFSLFYFVMLWTGIGLMEMYAVYNAMHGIAVMFFVTNTIAFLLETTMLTLIVTFKLRAKRLAATGITE